ncbi:uncharacterized protein G2W53_010760 [Senna tora]|uniref:Uncharacterized protein n=1 Tax=Senna tora TaxID=362788 RepID=A0A835C9U0_9FABA|nr:uncharacterized protein G2W53_010760 [Senna tora]
MEEISTIAYEDLSCKLSGMSLRPIFVPLNNDEIDKEVDQAHQGKQ